MATKKTAKKSAKKELTQAEKNIENMKLINAIKDGKKRGIVLIVEKQKGMLSTSSMNHEFTHGDMRTLISQLIELVNPEIKVIAALLRK